MRSYSNRPMMDEFTADAFVNRDEPIPTLALSGNDTPAEAPPDPKGKRERLKESAASKLKERVQDIGAEDKKHGFSLSDRLFAKCAWQSCGGSSSPQGLNGADAGCCSKLYRTKRLKN